MFCRNCSFVLVFDDVVATCRDEFRSLYTGELQFKDLLRTSSTRFQNTWKSFEAVLLEQAVLRHLFEVGYAPERGGLCKCEHYHDSFEYFQMLTEPRPLSKCAANRHVERSSRSVLGAASHCIARLYAKRRTGVLIELDVRKLTRNHVCCQIYSIFTSTSLHSSFASGRPRR